jgi:hypothetical protein
VRAPSPSSRKKVQHLVQFVELAELDEILKTISISRILEEDHVQDGKEVSKQMLSLKKM